MQPTWRAAPLTIGVAIDGRIGVDMASVKARKDAISAKSRVASRRC